MRTKTKRRIKGLLQGLLGYERYLRAFAWYKARTLHWDRREKDFFHFVSNLPERAVVLDVGANLGFLCVRLARQVRRGRVIAFEPLPDNHRVLCWLLRRFRIANVEVYPCALGDRNGSASMVLPVRNRVREQGLGRIVAGEAGEPQGIPFEVPVRRLDDLKRVIPPWVRVSAMKMDVENFERFVLLGALRILRRDRPLVYLELWDNENRRVCFSIAERLGYDVCVYVDDRLVPFDPARHRHGNFFFVPRPRTGGWPSMRPRGVESEGEPTWSIVAQPGAA